MISLFGYNDIELVVLDKDGTLIDSHIFWSEVIRRRAEAIIRKHALSQNEMAQLCHIMGLDIKSGRLRPEGPIAIVSRNKVIEIVCDFILSSYNIRVTQNEMAQLFDEVHRDFAPYMNDFIRLLPGVNDFLSHIAGHVRIALITSDGRDSTLNALNRTDILHYFDDIITRDDCPIPKVTGTPLLQLLDRTKVSPSHTLVVGDAEMDYRMAAAAGVEQVLLVTTGQSSAAELRKCAMYNTHCKIVERL